MITDEEQVLRGAKKRSTYTARVKESSRFLAVSGKATKLEDEGHRMSPRRKLGRHPRTWTRPKTPLENARMGLPTSIKGHVSDEGTVAKPNDA